MEKSGPKSQRAYLEPRLKCIYIRNEIRYYIKRYAKVLKKSLGKRRYPQEQIDRIDW